MGKLLVIIVTYNAMKWANRCFSSLNASSIRPVIFVVDNGSTDGTQDFIKRNYKDVIFYQSDSNLGFGKANNLGMKYALDNCFDYVYLLNQDAWVMPDTFEHLINTLTTHKEYGIISPLQMNADFSKLDMNFSLQYNNRKRESDGLSEVSAIMAAHWMLSIECIKTVGLFSPMFYHYREDDNYIDRLHYHGLKCGTLDNAKAVHDREFRKDSIEKIADLDYKGRIQIMSDPQDNIFRCMITQPIRLLLRGNLYGWGKTLYYVFLLFKQYPDIIKFRELSKSKGAFI